MKSLTDEWRDTKDRDAELTRDELIVQYLPLVKYVLGKLRIYTPQHLDEEDMIQRGIMGLIAAAEKFDPSRRVAFKTYAIPRIRGAILDELRKDDWIPRSARKKANLLEQAQNALRTRLRRNPTLAELARAIGSTQDKTGKMLSDANFASILSLDSIIPQEDGAFDTDLEFADPRGVSPAEACEQRDRTRLLAEAIADLPDGERLVITLYHFEDLMLREVGEVLGISESRVSQLHSMATMRLRAWMKKTVSTHAAT